MTPEDDGLFVRLTPPPGGADALRLRLRRERRSRRGRRVAGALGVAAGGVALALVGAEWSTAGRERPSVPAELHPALVSIGLQAPPAEPATVPPEMRHRMALQRVPLDTDRVVFYYLAVLPETPPEPGG